MPVRGALESLAAVASQLSAPLPLDRMAAVVSAAATRALDTTVVIAARQTDGRLRAARLPDAGQSVVLLPVPPRALRADERAYLGVLATLLGLALERERHANRLRVGDLQIDLGEQLVLVDDRAARLTPSEIRLLRFLAQEPGRARTRREILGHLWHTDTVVDERACDVHISNLRRKIERDPAHPRRLVTVRSVGYALKCEGLLTNQCT